MYDNVPADLVLPAGSCAGFTGPVSLVFSVNPVGSLELVGYSAASVSSETITVHCSDGE